MAQSSLLRVFVYGTLKRGEPNHYWLSDSKNGYSNFVATGTTTKKCPLVIGTRYNIPFLLDKEGVGKLIKGEVYEIDKKMLGNLDILEDYPIYYDREVQNILVDNGCMLPCWIYLIRNFPDSMLKKEFLESYRDSTEKPYLESIDATSVSRITTVEQVLKEMSE